MSGADADKTSKTMAAEPQTNWQRLRSLTDKQIRAGLHRDPDVNPTDETFWAKAKLVMPRSEKNANLEKPLDTIENEPGLQRMMKASAADIEADRVLNTNQLRRRRKQTKKAKGRRS
jgi:hypothetical protein